MNYSCVGIGPRIGAISAPASVEKYSETQANFFFLENWSQENENSFFFFWWGGGGVGVITLTRIRDGIVQKIKTCLNGIPLKIVSKLAPENFRRGNIFSTRLQTYHWTIEPLSLFEIGASEIIINKRTCLEF